MPKWLRWTLTAFLIFMAAVFLEGQWSHKRLSEPFFQELEELEQKGDYGALTSNLVDRANGKLGKTDSLLTNFWLKKNKRLTSGHFPALYLYSLYEAKQGRIRESAKWYVTAAIVSRIDAPRCADPTASQAITVIESLFSAQKKYLTSHPSDKKRFTQKALNYEEKHKDRLAAEWICAHGINAFKTKSRRLLETDWKEQRLRIRKELAAG